MSGRNYPTVPVVSRNIIVGTLAVIFAAFALIHNLDRYSLWLDDMLVLDGAESIHSLADVFDWDRRPTTIVNPPLFPIVLNQWIAVAGDTDVALRILSVYTAVICVAIVYRTTLDLSRHLYTAFLAAILLPNIGFFDYYARAVHSYGFMVAESAALLFFSFRWWQNQKRAYGAGVALSTAALFYTHYHALYFIVGANLTVMILNRQKAKQLLPQWIKPQLIALVLCLPWMPILYELARGGYQESTEYVVNTVNSDDDLGRLLTKMTRRFFYDGIEFHGLLLVLGAAATIPKWGRLRHNVRRVFFVAVLLFGVTLIIALLGNTAFQTFRPRRALYLLIPLVMILGTLLAQIRPVILGSILLIFFLLTPNHPTSTGLAGNWFYRESVQHIVSNAQPGDAVYLNYNTWFDTPPFRHYLDRLLPSGIPYVVVGEDPSALTDMVWPRERVWAIWRDEFPVDWTEPFKEREIVELERVRIGAHNVSLFAINDPPHSLADYAIPNPQGLVLPQVFGAMFRLTDYAVNHVNVSPGDTLEIWLDWTLAQPTDQDWTIYVHFYEDDPGTLLAQADGPPLHLGYAVSTAHWPADKPFYDYHSIAIPPDTPPGIYHLRIGVYNRDEPLRLPVSPGDEQTSDDGLVIANITVR